MALKSIPFSEVVAKVAELSEGNHDETLSTSALTFTKEETHPHGALVVGGDEGSNGEVLPLTAVGFGSMAKQLEIPARYMAKLDTEEEVRHVNMWLRDTDTTWQLRLNAANGVRSVQKAGFTPIDVLPTLEAIAPMVEEEGLVVTHVVPDLDDFHLRCVWPASHGSDADPLHAGFHMNATEANLHLFTVDAACYRTLCLNTAILRRDKALFAQRHYYLNFDEFQPRLLDGLQRVQVVGQNLCGALARCRGEHMSQADMQEELKRLLNMKALPKRFVEQASEAVEEGRVEEATRFGLINMVTREAQEFGQGERKFTGRMRVEGVAGRMLLQHMGSTLADPASSAVSEETATAILEGDDDEPPGPEGEPEMVGDGSSVPDPPEDEEPDLEAQMRAALDGVGDEAAEEPEDEAAEAKAPAKKRKKKKTKKAAKKKRKKKTKKVDEPDERTTEDAVAEDAEEPEAEEPEVKAPAKKKKKAPAKKKKKKAKVEPEPEPEPEPEEPEADEPEADEPDDDEIEPEVEDDDEDDPETDEHDEEEAEDADELEAEDDDDEEDEEGDEDEEDEGEEEEETEDEDDEEEDDEDDVEESEEEEDEEDDDEDLDDLLNGDDLEPVEA